MCSTHTSSGEAHKYPPPAPPPISTMHSSKDGEIVEAAKSASKPSRPDIFSQLENVLNVCMDIMEEDWEDLVKGDV